MWLLPVPGPEDNPALRQRASARRKPFRLRSRTALGGHFAARQRQHFLAGISQVAHRGWELMLTDLLALSEIFFALSSSKHGEPIIAFYGYPISGFYRL